MFPSWITFLLPPILVAAAAFAWLSISENGGPGAIGNTPTGSMKADGVYYVFVSEIELYPKNPEGDPWDSGSSAAPDIRYRIIWQDVTIHESETKDDSLIAEWSGVREGALNKLLGEDKLNSGKLRATGDGKLKIEVEDVDALTPNDPAGTVELEIMGLQEGVNDFRYDEKTDQSAIKRLRIRLVSKDQALEDIIRKMR